MTGDARAKPLKHTVSRSPQLLTADGQAKATAYTKRHRLTHLPKSLGDNAVVAVAVNDQAAEGRSQAIRNTKPDCANSDTSK